MRLFALGLCVAAAGCGPGHPVAAPTPGPPTHDVAGGVSFADDLAFLRAHGEVLLLESPGGGRVALSARYQGRVMTSAVEAEGASLGFVYRPFIESKQSGTQFDNYGGEDRFWLGPEGGQFGLYFPPGAPFTFTAWQTPHELQEGPWEVRERAADRVVFSRSMKVVSWSNTTFHVDIERTVRLLGADEVAARVGSPAAGTKWVAFESSNVLRNAGKAAWTKETGLLSVWILAMYEPRPDTVVAIPLDPTGSGEVNDAYFGKVPADRLKVRDDHLLFKCDGDHRSKVGIPPGRAREWAGSYSASARLLTLVHHDKPAGAVDYVNSMWEQQSEPYRGDVVNSYNDGPTEPGAAKLGGFYELETSSPAAALLPGEALVHTHRTFHFVGDAAALDPLAQRALGLTASYIADGLR